MTLITPLGSFLIYAFIVLAVRRRAVALAVITEFVVTNRRARLARHESISHYYRGLALAH